MTLGPQRLTLQPNSWYGWQMIPGYSGRCVPYFSPVLVRKALPLKTGRSILRLKFRNALYAEGVQESDLELQVLRHAADYLVAAIPGDDHVRTAVVCSMGFEWLEATCPDLITHNPPAPGSPAASSVTLYLRELFGE